MEKSTKSNIDFKKRAFQEAYKKAFGNVTQSCNAIGIDRSTYYDWIKKDEKFKKQIEELEPEERFMDFLESKLVERINKGDTTSIIFALKTKAKKRGYVERQEIEHSSDVETDIIFEIHKRKEESES
jgi:transposase-like protein